MSVMISLHDRLWRNGLLVKACYNAKYAKETYFDELLVIYMNKDVISIRNQYEDCRLKSISKQQYH